MKDWLVGMAVVLPVVVILGLVAIILGTKIALGVLAVATMLIGIFVIAPKMLGMLIRGK